MRALCRRLWFLARAWWTWHRGVPLVWCADCEVMLTDAGPCCEECQATRATKIAAAARHRDAMQTVPALALLAGMQNAAMQNTAYAHQHQQDMQSQYAAAHPSAFGLGNMPGLGLGNTFVNNRIVNTSLFVGEILIGRRSWFG